MVRSGVFARRPMAPLSPPVMTTRSWCGTLRLASAARSYLLPAEKLNPDAVALPLSPDCPNLSALVPLLLTTNGWLLPVTTVLSLSEPAAIPEWNATSFRTPPSGLKLWHSPLTVNTLPSAPTTTVSTSTELATGVSRARATSTPPTSWLSIGAASPSTSERTAALTSSSSGTSPKSHRTPQAVPTSRTLSGPPPPASSSGRPLVSTPEAPMAPMSTPFAAPTTSRSSPLVTISVS